MAASSFEEPSSDVFVGRQTELARLSEAMSDVRRGRPWLLTVEGQSGIGKTALVRHWVASRPEVRCFWARGDPAESELAYGIVEQLVRPVDDNVLADYPLLTGDVGGSSPVGVGGQLLGVIGKLQSDGPVVIVIDDMQWADRRSVEAISFMLRRLSVDPVLLIAMLRGERDQLDEASRRMLLAVERRSRLGLTGLRLEDVEPLADALGVDGLQRGLLERLFESTGGHTLYLRTLLGDRESWDRPENKQVSVPSSLAFAIGDQLAVLPEETRSLLEMLAVLNTRLSLALVGEAAAVSSPSAVIDPAVKAGLVDWSPHEPTAPVSIRHALQRDAIYASLAPGKRRELHARAVNLVDETSAWYHRVASLDQPDEDLAGRLELLAVEEAGRGRLPMAATHLLWASDISTQREDRERRLLTAVLHLMLAEEARGLTLRDAVELCGDSPLRNCVLGTMAFASGQLTEAEMRFTDALDQARRDPDAQPLAALAANRLAGTYTLLGAGKRVMTLGRWALDTGCLDAAADSQTRTLIAIGASQVGGPRQALTELDHLESDPARVERVHADGLSFRGVFQLLSGNLSQGVADLVASIRLVRRGATFTLGVRAYPYLALGQYLAGAWDDALLTSEQGFSAAAIHPRRFELPLLHLAASCVATGRGATEGAEYHIRMAEEAAAVLDYGQERLYAAMARALAHQAAGNYRGMADALEHWHDEGALDDRTRTYGVFWRPLLVEGLIGSGRYDEGEVALQRLRDQAGDVTHLQSALAWLGGWLAEERDTPEAAHRVYQAGEDSAETDSPVYRARLLLAHGRLLRRTGQRRQAIERLRGASNIFVGLGAGPFVARTEEELAGCGLPRHATKRRSSLEMTNRESEVAYLVGQRMTNAEIASELFITPKAVEYHLGNIYAKFGLKGRQQLRDFLADSRRPSPV
jgi:DNA-binding CsgD family transcriptional regulator